MTLVFSPSVDTLSGLQIDAGGTYGTAYSRNMALATSRGPRPAAAPIPDIARAGRMPDPGAAPRAPSDNAGFPQPRRKSHGHRHQSRRPDREHRRRPAVHLVLPS